jgi:hypothetical protein
VVLIKEFGKIPVNARKVRIPLFLEHRFGKVYCVGDVDAALVRGDYVRAYDLVERSMDDYFSRLLNDAIGDRFPHCAALESEQHRELILREAVEGTLKEHYDSNIVSRELSRFIEGKRLKRVVLFQM